MKDKELLTLNGWIKVCDDSKDSLICDCSKEEQELYCPYKLRLLFGASDPANYSLICDDSESSCPYKFHLLFRTSDQVN
jgi:hypothetical protein